MAGASDEIVRQLRDEAGDCQVADARIAQWATCLGDAIIFGRDGSGPGAAS